MQKLVILMESIDCEFDIDRLRLPEIESRGYCIEVWALTRLCFPHVNLNIHITRERYPIRYIQSKKECRKRLRDNKDAIFFDMLGVMKNYPIKRWMRMWLSKARCRYYLFFLNAVLNVDALSDMPQNVDTMTEELHPKENKVITIAKNIRRLGLFSYIKIWLRENIINPLERRLLKIYLPKKIFLGTQENRRAVPDVYKDVPIIYTHSWDYEQYLSDKDGIKKYGEKIITFIDSAATHHPDDKYKGCKPFANEEEIEKYYRNMCDLFEKVERVCNCSVVVAAHPRSNYQGNEFENRKIVKGKTHELIANSILVITPRSTALTYVMLYKIPFILAERKTPKYYNKNQKLQLQSLISESFFGKKAIFIGEFENIDVVDYIIDSKVAMDRYVSKFVIEDTVDQNKKFWEIVFEHM